MSNSRKHPFLASIHLVSLFCFLLLTLTAPLAASVKYQFFRFTPELLRGEGSEDSVQIAEFEPRHQGNAVSGATAGNPGGDNPDSPPYIQTPDKAVDGDVNTKWLDFNKRSLVLDFGQQVTIDGYRFATGGDFPDRDPISWSVYGSQDGSTWEPLDVQVYKHPPMDRNTFTQVFEISAPPEIATDRGNLSLITHAGRELPDDSTRDFAGFYRQQINNSGQVMVHAFYRPDQFISRPVAYLWENDALQTLAETSSARLNDQGETLIYDILPHDDDTDPNSDERYLLGDKQNPSDTQLIREGRTQAPPGSGYHLRHLVGSDFSNSPIIKDFRFTNQGSIVFTGHSENAEDDILRGIYSADAQGLTTIIQSGDTSVVPGKTVHDIEAFTDETGGLLDVNDNGQVLFTAVLRETGGSGDYVETLMLYSPSEGVEVITDESVVDGLGFGELTDDGQVFFTAYNSEWEIWGDADGDGSYEPIVEPLDSVGSETIQELGHIAISNSGIVVFGAVTGDAFTAPDTGLFQWQDGNLTTLIPPDAVFDAMQGARMRPGVIHVNRPGDVVLQIWPNEIDAPDMELLVGIPAGGKPQVLAQSGELVGGIVIEGQDRFRAIQSFDLTPLSEISYNSTYRILNDAGQLVVQTYLSALSDQNAAVLLAEVEPSHRPEFDLQISGMDELNDTLEVQVEGPPNSTVTLESTTDLDSNWNSADTLQLDATGSTETELTLPASEDHAFYRGAMEQ